MADLKPMFRSVMVVAFGFLALAPAALAQSTGTDPNSAPRVDASEGFGSAEPSGGAFGDSGSLFDLIHRATLANDRTPGEFSRQHRGRISDETANYRTLQQEALQRQSADGLALPAAETVAE
jgi:hypothetical protein